jgi:phage tail sheath protein FI
MPEYLAPGVYVEETSFRAKSIEGVSTSTTAFVGPTRRGPVGDVPELVTSFADFQRIYGGLDDLFGMPNFVAHAARSYFNEGGGRLYVSRAFQAGGSPSGGVAASPTVLAGGGPGNSFHFVARFPGGAGNGRITLIQQATPATVQTMANARPGTLLRTGGSDAAVAPARPARLKAAGQVFTLKDGQSLTVAVSGGAPATVNFKGEAAFVTGTALPDAVIDFGDAASRTLTVEIDGETQTVTLSAQNLERAAMVEEVNSQLRGGWAEITANKLRVGTERRGSGASVKVHANPAFGFAADLADVNVADASNTVADVAHVTPSELDALLTPHGVRVLQNDAGEVWFTTVATGAAATLAVTAGAAQAAIGLATTTATGSDGPEIEYWLRGDGGGWTDAGGGALSLGGLLPNQAPPGGADFLSMVVVADDADGNQSSYEGVGFDPAHPQWIGHILAVRPSRRAEQLEHMYAFEFSGSVPGLALRNALFGSTDRVVVDLAGGDDGGPPMTAAYEAAFGAMEPLDDVSIVAAPGHSAYEDWQGIQGALIQHVERPRAYRIAVLDTPPEQIVGEARQVRSLIDSTKAALYYPWVTVSNPQARPGRDDIPREINLPPSGFVAGVYARSDVQRGVHKAPANEVVRSAIRFESDINYAQQEVLNPLGVNCLRFFAGRGFRVWGARTVSSDPEWKYVNVRRYFNYLERSIDQGTQWAVFESNGERLWANVRETISSFLYNEWRNGALLGGSAKEAYFVKCDRSTMTQNDLDNGRLICLIGVAALKPAEFVIFRIGQKTADNRS